MEAGVLAQAKKPAGTEAHDRLVKMVRASCVKALLPQRQLSRRELCTCCLSHPANQAPLGGWQKSPTPVAYSAAPNTVFFTQVSGVKPRKIKPDTEMLPLSSLPCVGHEPAAPAAGASTAATARDPPTHPHTTHGVQSAAPAAEAPKAHISGGGSAAAATPPVWTATMDAHIAAAVRAFTREKKEAAAAGAPAPKISWTRVAAEAPLPPGHPPLKKPQVKARFAELKASGALKKAAKAAPAPAPAPVPTPAAPKAAPAPAPQPAPTPAPVTGAPFGASWSAPTGQASSSPGDVMAAMLARHAGGAHVLGGEPAAPPLTPFGTTSAINSHMPNGSSTQDAFVSLGGALDEGSHTRAAKQAPSGGGLIEEDIIENDFDEEDASAGGTETFITRELQLGAAAAAGGGGGVVGGDSSTPPVHLPNGVTRQALEGAGGEMIQPAVAQGLRELLFGVPDASAAGARPLRCLDAKWVKQGVQMDPHDGMRFGLVQHEGGPCGALAALQATTLKHLYFRDTPLPALDPPMDPPLWDLILQGISSKDGAHRTMQFAALAGRKGQVSSLAAPIPDAAWGTPPAHALALSVLQAFGDIVWRCAQQGVKDGSTAILALPCSDVSVVGGGGLTRRAAPLTSSEGGGSLTIRSDGLTERLALLPCRSRAELDAALSEHAGVLLQPHAPTAVCLVYSAALSRGLGLPGAVTEALATEGHGLNAACSAGSDGGVLGDMDTGLGSEAKLIGAHNYATQELVNLLLTGKASSNVHDGEMRLGEGGDATVLRGVNSRSDVGFLTLFEHYGYMAVGEHFKQPAAPVWVVCSESHYSTLFALPPVALGKLSPQAWWEALGGVQGGSSGDSLELEGVHFVAQRACRSSVSDGPTGRVDLAYYDGLDKQDAPIHFTLHVEGGAHSGAAAAPAAGPKVVTAFTALGKGHRGGDDMDTPPLEMVLRTRWPGANVEWNATEPLL